mgnify:CR=1 FL=1
MKSNNQYCSVCGKQKDEKFIEFASDELEKIGVIKKENIIDSFTTKVKKAKHFLGSAYQLAFNEYILYHRHTHNSNVSEQAYHTKYVLL